MTDHQTILGLETSCDETAAAVVRADGRVLADVVASQIDLHARYGGVVPELASRAHLRAIVPVVEEAVERVGGWDAIDAVAVTQGPGLVGALLVGVQFAKALAWARDRPLIGVDHLQGHLLACHLRHDDEAPVGPGYPYVALLVSGGHTALYRVDEPTGNTLLGQTRDDAAGEAFDKAAKLLGLGYPGGPIIDRLAKEGDAAAFDLPRPMLHRKDHDFSFSGLKTAVARIVADDEGVSRPDLAASLQGAIVEVLARKAVRCCLEEDVPRLVLGGGVAANRGLRQRAGELCAEAGLELFVPPIRSCTDNAAMIAYAGFHADGDEPVAVYSRAPNRVRGRFREDGTHIPRRAGR
ncbi:MAG: tRNA (adenosine(37)-N6)-threonylcarbamoyltransferase complex transferase subunit TsaD [Sandaracinus sp.]|nr:tRNA (adenosine(37)-N6)-threonylcarbamoyltransferase complex transferase subunit TsaD [Sandaracinus sp.]